MKTTNIDKIPPGPELDALVVEKVMGWKNVHRHGASKDGKGDGHTGRKPDKLGRWRLAEVPPYSTNPVESAAIEARMKELGLLQKYLSEVGKIAHAKGVPAEWATADQRCRAAIRTVRTPLRLIHRLGARKAATVRKKKGNDH
ncbi:MAG TPA: hypothetical protein VGA09_11400 [Candidatus Binatia bacterium]